VTHRVRATWPSLAPSSSFRYLPRVTVRPETPTDHAAVERVHELAFGADGEARLVRAMRSPRCLSLVAEEGGEIVGHVFFTPVAVDAGLEGAMALGPLAVTPERQRRGIGSALARAGLAACRRERVPAVFVLGHPDYYPRFGFAPASAAGLRCDWDVPDDVFQVVELSAGALRGVRGRVRYDAEFSKLG